MFYCSFFFPLEWPSTSTDHVRSCKRCRLPPIITHPRFKLSQLNFHADGYTGVQNVSYVSNRPMRSSNQLSFVLIDSLRVLSTTLAYGPYQSFHYVGFHDSNSLSLTLVPSQRIYLSAYLLSLWFEPGNGNVVTVVDIYFFTLFLFC